MKYIHRTIEPSVNEGVAAFPCIAVTGPRQSGKSTLLMQTLKGYNYVTFDDPITREQAIADPQLLLDSLGTKVIIDEIQLAPQILSYIKVRVDSRRAVKGQYVFTGSQKFSLIKNLGDSLAGRIGLYDLLPFSIDELGKAAPQKTVTESFIHAALRGLYSELVTDAAIKPESWFGSYVQTYLERDVRSIYNIGNLRDFQRFMQLLAGRIGQLLNLSSFAPGLGVSVPTIKSWLSILEAGRIIYLLPPYYNNDDRFHARDHGVRGLFRFQDHAPVEGYPAGDAETRNGQGVMSSLAMPRPRDPCLLGTTFFSMDSGRIEKYLNINYNLLWR